jgi:hypothetical protein
MADHVAIAGLIDDLAGAWLLSKAIAFTPAASYVSGSGTVRWAGAGGTDVTRDLERAHDAAEAQVGAFLLGVGFIGQAIGATQSNWSTTSGAVAYSLAVLAIVVGLSVRPWLQARRSRSIFFARLDGVRPPDASQVELAKTRYGIADTYRRWSGEADWTTRQVQGWVDAWTEERGRHPWREELGEHPDPE